MKIYARSVMTLAIATTACALLATSAVAAVSATEAARLRGDLTPSGAERAGNKDGTIPAWTGGFADHTPPIVGRRSDPFAAEKPLYSINAQNMAKYADKLTPGTQAMMKRYPTTFRVDVYPTHRTSAVPAWFEAATLKDATQTKVVVDASGDSRLEGGAGGLPFPIPQNGLEAMFNLRMSYSPNNRTTGSNYLVQADGKRILVSEYSTDVAHYFANTPSRAKNGVFWAVRSMTTNPPIRAGEAILAQYYEDDTKDSTWVYLPGQRRVRKLPSSCCDTPAPFAAGLISFDEILGTFGGSLHKFDWTLVGKKEMIVPYNANRVLVPKGDEVFSQYHLNPDFVRYELHRVWVVEAKLKAGERHASVRSTYYIDEDSWLGLLGERYDAQGTLARTGFMLPILTTEAGALLAANWGWYDLLSGSAYLGSTMNEVKEQLRLFDSFPSATYSPDALAAEGVR